MRFLQKPLRTHDYVPLVSAALVSKVYNFQVVVVTYS